MLLMWDQSYSVIIPSSHWSSNARTDCQVTATRKLKLPIPNIGETIPGESRKMKLAQYARRVDL